MAILPPQLQNQHEIPCDMIDIPFSELEDLDNHLMGT